MKVDYSNDLQTVLPKIPPPLFLSAGQPLKWGTVAECSSDTRSITERRAELAGYLQQTYVWMSKSFIWKIASGEKPPPQKKKKINIFVDIL